MRKLCRPVNAESHFTNACRESLTAKSLVHYLCMAKYRKTLYNQSVLQFKGRGGSIPRLKLDEPSQTVATDTIELCEIVIGLRLDGQS